MLDYPAIAALHAVIETQNFDMAARKLFITQSAISQRIKALENYYGKPVLVRTLPYQPTELGQALLGHYKRVTLFEEALQSELTSEVHSQKISIAISRDSLETWFVYVTEQLSKILPITLEIIADDQEVTLEYLRKGLVSACASTFSKAITGCKAEFLGYFDYVLVATPEFKNKYFKNKKAIIKNLQQAPAVIFDSQDFLHMRYLKHFFKISNVDLNFHVIPSVSGFRQFALNSYAYALIPEMDARDDLKRRKLINLFPDKIWEMPLYWHTWAIEAKSYQAFNNLILNTTRKHLRQ